MSDTIEQQLAAAHARNRDLALSIGNARALLAQHGFQQTPEDTLDVMVARAMAAPRGRVVTEEAIAGAVFDFAGFLTTRESATLFGASADASPMVALLSEWASTRNLNLNNADVERWHLALADAEPEQPRGRVAEPYTPSRRALRAWQVSSEELRKLHYCRMMDERHLALVDADAENPTPARAEGAGVKAEAIENAANHAVAEVSRAMVKFATWPTDPLHALAVVGEEFGELTQAVLQRTYEPKKGVTAEEIRTEAMQLAAMALRFYASLPAYVYAPGVQHSQSTPTAACTTEGGE